MTAVGHHVPGFLVVTVTRFDQKRYYLAVYSKTLKRSAEGECADTKPSTA